MLLSLFALLCQRYRAKRKIYVTVESYESFSDKKECEYDINCPEKEKELYDELVKRGFFVALPNV